MPEASSSDLLLELKQLQRELHHEVEGYSRGQELHERWTRIFSHSLNNQMFTVFFLLDGLSDAEAEGDASRDVYLEGLKTMSSRLYQTITRLSDLANWTGAEEDARTDLALVLSELTESVSAYAQHKGIQLRWFPPSEPLLVRGEVTAISEIYAQLLVNAVKYSPLGHPREPAWVSIIADGDDDEVFIEIENGGAGLSANELANLFQPGAIGSAPPSGGEPQVGHGLALVKDTVELLGGQISCHSEPGHFTRFIVKLMRAQ